MRVETGDLTTPGGTPYRGFKVSIGGIQDPAQIKRTYDDIEKIIGGNNLPFKTYEEKTSTGTFLSYRVET